MLSWWKLRKNIYVPRWSFLGALLMWSSIHFMIPILLGFQGWPAAVPSSHLWRVQRLMPSSSRRITASALLTFSTSIGMESLGRCRCHMFRGRLRCRTSEIHSQDQPGSGSLKVFLDLEGTCYLLKVMIFHDIISLCASNILRSTLKEQTIDCDSSRITKGWSD